MGTNMRIEMFCSSVNSVKFVGASFVGGVRGIKVRYEIFGPFAPNLGIFLGGQSRHGVATVSKGIKFANNCGLTGRCFGFARPCKR